MIVLLTDFGHSPYVGVMKGVIFSRASDARVVDLFNAVKRHNIREGAWVLLNSFRAFPKGSIFLCVVDPGVGGNRRCVAARTKDYRFLGPDNGLMWPAMEADGMLEAVELSQEGASSTFHGRDVFAPAAALLERGRKLSSLGKRVKTLERLAFHLSGREGEIVAVDRFGNLITNIPPLPGKKTYQVSAEGFERRLAWHPTYRDSPHGELFLITGSSATLELSVREESAAEKSPLREGMRLRIT